MRCEGVGLQLIKGIQKPKECGKDSHPPTAGVYFFSIEPLPKKEVAEKNHRQMAFCFFHSDFYVHIKRHMPYHMAMRSIECAEIKVDMEKDTRPLVLFRFLSNNRQNDVLRAIMGHNDPALRFKKALNVKALQAYCGVYDAMDVVIDGEALTVAYSIEDLESPIRSGILGPHGVKVYDGRPHFGPIFVYRSNKKEYENELGETVVEHNWCEIVTPPDRICERLREGILAPCG